MKKETNIKYHVCQGVWQYAPTSKEKRSKQLKILVISAPLFISENQVVIEEV